MAHLSPSRLSLVSVFFLFCLAAPAFAGQNKIGTATLTEHACDPTGASGGTCYRAVVSDCPEATADFAATVKVNQPPASAMPKGTVFLTSGGVGDAFYDYNSSFLGDTRCSGSNCGMMVVESLNSKNYRTVQIKFTDPEGLINEPSGWLTGPSTDGPRSLACRYATIVHAVWSVLLKKDTAHPVCATGNSAGGSLVAYAITQYGMGNSSGPGPAFTFAEPTSGPPMARLDQACAGASAPIASVGCPAGAQISDDFGLATAADFIDPAYGHNICTTDINSNGREPYASFRHDSVLSDDFAAPSYKTVVRTLYGSDDMTSAVPLGLEWYAAIKSSKSQACISGAPHELPGNFNGASAIVTDIGAHCQ